MSTQTERMQQLINAKKNKSTQNAQVKHPEKSLGASSSKGFNSKKNGGTFDK